jgi:hypothetical protein
MSNQILAGAPQKAPVAQEFGTVAPSRLAHDVVDESRIARAPRGREHVPDQLRISEHLAANQAKAAG